MGWALTDLKRGTYWRYDLSESTSSNFSAVMPRDESPCRLRWNTRCQAVHTWRKTCVIRDRYLLQMKYDVRHLGSLRSRLRYNKECAKRFWNILGRPIYLHVREYPKLLICDNYAKQHSRNLPCLYKLFSLNSNLGNDKQLYVDIKLKLK